MQANPMLTVTITVVVAVTALVLSIQASMTRPPDTSRAFFTTDDGKTWFVDSASNIPPFDKDGKTAYRCSVYECDGKQFVLEMQRYDEKSAQALRDAQAAAAQQKDQPTDPRKRAPGPNPQLGLQIKAPGDTKWYSVNDVTAMNRMTAAVKCGAGYATAVLP